jgi:hypothetical protein
MQVSVQDVGKSRGNKRELGCRRVCKLVQESGIGYDKRVILITIRVRAVDLNGVQEMDDEVVLRIVIQVMLPIKKCRGNARTNNIHGRRSKGRTSKRDSRSR